MSKKKGKKATKKQPDKPKPETPKAGFWAPHPEAVAGVMKMTATQYRHSPLRFRCGKCHKEFIGLMMHRDRVPDKCSVCEPREGEWTWRTQWIPAGASGLALAK